MIVEKSTEQLLEWDGIQTLRDIDALDVIKLDFCSQGLVQILWLKLRRDFEVEVWSFFFCSCLVEVMKFSLGQDFEPWFGKKFEV